MHKPEGLLDESLEVSPVVIKSPFTPSGDLANHYYPGLTP